MSEQPSHDEVVNLEADETIPPRPEEEVADALRATPDQSGTGERADGDQ
ncbi:hypothetical protein [Cellulomonas fimi]|uniref:Uncharacterized protein n=1 Tax=Cellulomonas fimi TaxID=1708 RepID=A0A7Y0QIS3_CELFI|nr:hypothetical protein [Cellulomonas fimi]NMR21543.1 hypothetical protein [Cellulomonas fimi]